MPKTKNTRHNFVTNYFVFTVTESSRHMIGHFEYDFYRLQSPTNDVKTLKWSHGIVSERQVLPAIVKIQINQQQEAFPFIFISFISLRQLGPYTGALSKRYRTEHTANKKNNSLHRNKQNTKKAEQIRSSTVFHRSIGAPNNNVDQ